MAKKVYKAGKISCFQDGIYTAKPTNGYKFEPLRVIGGRGDLFFSHIGKHNSKVTTITFKSMENNTKDWKVHVVLPTIPILKIFKILKNINPSFIQNLLFPIIMASKKGSRALSDIKSNADFLNKKNLNRLLNFFRNRDLNNDANICKNLKSKNFKNKLIHRMYSSFVELGKYSSQLTSSDMNIPQDCLVLSLGNVTQHSYSCNGGSRLILGYMNTPVKPLDESDLEQLPQDKDSMNIEASISSFPGDDNQITYTYIDCTKEAKISFTLDLFNTPAGLVTTVYMVPMNYKIDCNLYNEDYPEKNDENYATKPEYKDREYANRNDNSNSVTNYDTYVTYDSWIHSNYTNKGDYGEEFVFYDESNTEGYKKSIIKWLDQYRSVDDEQLNLKKKLGDEWGFGYNDAQGLGMGSSIEIDIVEATPCSCAVTLHGLCNVLGYTDKNYMRGDLSEDDWTEYDKEGYGANIHCGILLGQTIYSDDVTNANKLTFREIIDGKIFNTFEITSTDNVYNPATYGPLPDTVSRTSFDNSILKYNEQKDLDGFFINSLLPFDVDCTITPSENDVLTLKVIIRQTYPNNIVHEAEFLICSGGFPTTKTPQTNGVAVQENTQNLHKMNVVIANWCTSTKFNKDYDEKPLPEYDDFNNILTKNDDLYNHKINTSWWLDGCREMSDDGIHPNRGWVLPDDSGNFSGSTENQDFYKTTLYKEMIDAYKYYSKYSLPGSFYVKSANTELAKELNVCSSLIQNMKIDATVKAKDDTELNANGVSCYIMDLMFRGLTSDGYNITNWKGSYNSGYGVSYSKEYTGDRTEAKAKEIYENMPENLQPVIGTMVNYQNEHYLDTYTFYSDDTADGNSCKYNLASEMGHGTSIQTSEIEFLGNANNYIISDSVSPYHLFTPYEEEYWDNFNVYDMSKYGLNVLSAPGVILSNVV